METATQTNLVSVNGVVVVPSKEENLSDETIRQRVCLELLRQDAEAHDLLAKNDQETLDGVQSEEATRAIEALLEKQLMIEPPSDEDCERYYQGHEALFTHGEQIDIRHILFAVTEGVDVNALRQRAETVLLEVRCQTPETKDEVFFNAAKTLSNCPSGASGGELGWLTKKECAPEFASEVFGGSEIGVLSRLVHSRFGFHIVEVKARKAGVLQTYEDVQGAVVMMLQQKKYATQMRQYLSHLAEKADIIGMVFEISQ